MFRNHRIRESVTLDGLWDFAPVEGNEPPSQRNGLTFGYRLMVPGCWETHPDLRTYRGAGVYRRTVRTERTGAIRLEFKGVSHTARVFWDGAEVASHYNAYTQHRTDAQPELRPAMRGDERILNECASDCVEGRMHYERQLEQIRAGR